jgi:hypothetical protein
MEAWDVYRGSTVGPSLALVHQWIMDGKRGYHSYLLPSPAHGLVAHQTGGVLLSPFVLCGKKYQLWELLMELVITSPGS